MNLRDMIFGVGLFCVGNLAMYMIYPLFNAFISGMTNPDLGTLAMGSGLEMISWGGFLGMWLLLGGIVPAYLIISGATQD